MPNPGDVVTIAGCPCCGSSSSSRKSSSSSSSSSYVPHCDCPMPYQFQFTISDIYNGKLYYPYDEDTSSKCRNLNKTYTLTRRVSNFVDGTCCYCDWVSDPLPIDWRGLGTTCRNMWHLVQAQVSGTQRSWNLYLELYDLPSCNPPCLHYERTTFNAGGAVCTPPATMRSLSDGNFTYCLDCTQKYNNRPPTSTAVADITLTVL